MIDDNLLDLANSDLYLHNPFRALGLNSDASLREIKKKQRFLTLSREMGIVSDEPTYNIKGILEVPYGDNNDPIKRLLHRIFWIWPDKKKSQTAIIPVDYFTTAISFWKRQIKGGKSVIIPLHNLAVTYQLVFLESVQGGRQFSELVEASGELENACEMSLQYWMRLLKTKNFWQRIYDWVAEENDPRLDVNFLKRLRKQLSPFICVIYLNAAKKLHNAGKIDRSVDIVNHVWNIELPENVRDSALNYQFQKTREVVQAQISAYQENAIAMRPPAAEKILRENLTELKDNLTFAELLTDSNSQNSMTALVDTVAASFLNTIKKHDPLGKGLFLAMHTLADMRDLPASASLQQRVVDEQKKVREIFNKGNYWYSEKYFNAREPIVEELEKSHQLFIAYDYEKSLTLIDAILLDFSDITLNESKIISQSKSVVRNAYGMKLVSNAFSVLEKPRSLHLLIRMRKDRIYPWNNECAACGGRIYGEYYNYQFEGKNYKVCGGCSREDRKQTAMVREKLENFLSKGRNQLEQAIKINHQNIDAKTNLSELDKFARKMGFTRSNNSSNYSDTSPGSASSEKKNPTAVWVWIGIILLIICYAMGGCG